MDNMPAGIGGWCFRALGALGGGATTTEVREWARQQGEELATSQVRGALHALAARRRPLVEVTRRGRAGYGAPNHWRSTARGRELLATLEVAR